MTEAKVYASADNIQVMNAAGGYDTYFMWNGASGKSGTADPTKRGWAKAGKTELCHDRKRYPEMDGAEEHFREADP